MAFAAQANPVDIRNRQNILQELQQQRQQLLQAHPVAQVPSSSTGAPQRLPFKSTVNQEPQRFDSQHAPMVMSRRSALEYAAAYSNGFFVPQDSQFGNPILPVIPRFDDTT